MDGPSDFDLRSSPLPPSSAPDGTRDPPSRPAAALALEDDEPQEEPETPNTARRKRPKARTNGDVPLVRDAVGESVAENFETFLKT
jgi:DNA replication licensing factor MCM6